MAVKCGQCDNCNREYKLGNLVFTYRNTVEMVLRIRRSWMITMSKSEVWRHF